MIRYIEQALEVGEYPLYHRFIPGVMGGVAGEFSYHPRPLFFSFPTSALKSRQSCRRHPYMDTTPELMWTVRRDVCGHYAGAYVDTSML